jgi:hypothetical protein
MIRMIEKLVVTLMNDDYFSMTEIQRRKFSIINHPSYNNFDASMEELIEFFDSLESLISGRSLTVFLDFGKTYLFDTQLLLSGKYTLISIKQCCENGVISDANTLIRKFRDDIFFYLYVLEVGNNQVIYFDETRKHEVEGQKKKKQESFVIKWFKDELSNFDFSKNIIQYLKTNADVCEVIEKYKLEEIWKKINKNLNNYVHNNGASYCSMNFRDYRFEEIEDTLKSIVFKIDYISTIFVMLFILIKPHYIMASDYIDYRDVGMEPPDDSQYWVAPFIQSFIDEHIAHYNKAYKLFLKDKVSMDIK